MPEEIRMIKDRFRIDSLIAYGGMARVYKGTDLTLARTVAVKVLSEDLSRDPSFLLRFRREAQAAAALTHPNIVAVYDTGAEAGVHYIVMEYVEGSTLAQVLAEQGPLSPDRAAAIGSDVARALSAAHAKGIVHRDVKPGNIMIAKDGFVKVMDFGIAKAATSGALTQVGSILGTVAYLSPEQARGEEVDSRSDIYSLGAMIYQMLTGRAPLAAETLMEMVHKLNTQVPTAPSQLNPAVPEALEAVVMKTLAKEPARRYQQAGELSAALLTSLTADPSATAAYIVPPGEQQADRTLVAPVAAGAGDHRTEVIRASRAPAGRDPAPVPRVVVGGIILLALLLLGIFVLSSANKQQTPVVGPSPLPSVSFQPGLQESPHPTRRTAPPAPPTTVTVPPEPTTEPPVTGPQPPPEPPSPPPEPVPTTTGGGSSPPPVAGAPGADGAAGRGVGGGPAQ